MEARSQTGTRRARPVTESSQRSASTTARNAFCSRPRSSMPTSSGAPFRDLASRRLSTSGASSSRRARHPFGISTSVAGPLSGSWPRSLGQTQLRGLEIKWGDYDDISPVAGMPDLWNLNLGGASGLIDITALRSATSLRVLALEDCRRLTDFSPLGDLDTLEEFSLTSGFGSGSLTVPTIGFVRGMTGLRRLLVGARVLDEDYSPLLARTDLEELWVRKQRNMHPSLEELQSQIPGMRSN